MERFKKLLLALLVMSVALAPSFAEDKKEADCKCKKSVESYAHPTMFGSQSQIYSTSDSTYVVGGKIDKKKQRIGVQNKDYVFISTWAENVLDLIKSNSKIDAFNPKMPVLRSELAVILAEGFAMDQSAAGAKKYSDVTSEHWASSWIYKALASKIMIGYPDGEFKPDRPVTKAEVFATIAQIVNVPYSASGSPAYKGSNIKFIPTWANSATKEVVASNLLDMVPDSKKVIEDEYLSKEQVAYLVSALRSDLAYSNRLGLDSNAPDCIKNYKPIYINVKMNDRISAKHSNIGDKFTATTTQATTVDGKVFPVGSEVRGEVVKVQRPGINECGFVQVKFIAIKCDKQEACFPKKVSEAKAQVLKNPNIIARLFGAPFSGTARVVGVVGRTVGTTVNVMGNRFEEFGDNFANIFVETLTLHPGSGMKSAGYSVVTMVKGFVDVTKLLVSGTFGVLYEIGDEIVYTIVPSLSNDSALNPNEELVVIF